MKRFFTVLFILLSGLMMTACGAGSTPDITGVATQEANSEPTVSINATPGVPVITGTEIPDLMPALTEAGTGKPVGWEMPGLDAMKNTVKAQVQYAGGQWVASGEDGETIRSFIKSIDSQLTEQGNFRFLDYYNAVKSIPGAQKVEMAAVAGGSWILVAYDASGRILWQNPVDGLVAEYPYQLSVTAAGIAVVGTEFEALPPEITDVVWSGEKSVGVGEKVAIGGEEYYRLVWNPFDKKVEANNQADVVKALLGLDLSIDVANLPADSIKQAADGSWTASIDGKSYLFGLDGKWMEGNPAPSSELLAKLAEIPGYNPDRTFQVIDNFYVDTYNNAKWAKLDSGVWVETTLEEKYGDMAPLNPTEPYIDLGGMVQGDDYHNRDENYKSQVFHLVWTGDSFIRQVDDQERQISEEDGIFMLRDLHGVFRLVNIRFDSPDIEGVFGIYVQKQIEDGGSQTRPVVGELFDLLPLGEQIEVQVYYQMPKSAIQSPRCFNDGVCTDEYNAGARQFWLQENRIKAFIEALRAGEEIPEDSDLVLVPRHIVVKK